MIKRPFKKIRFHWMATPTGLVAHEYISSDRDISWVDLPMDPRLGTAGMCRLNLALGMALSFAKIEFTEEALGRMVTLVETEANLREPSFQAIVVRSLRAVFAQADPEEGLAISQGMDLFRYAQKYRSKVSADGSFSGEFHLLTVGRSVLNSLIGPEFSEQLIGKLGISSPPAMKVMPIPQFISNHLVDAISPAMIGDARKLHAQAQTLEFLALLVEHFCTPETFHITHDVKAKERARQVHDELIENKGRLPTLDELAERHGRSAKLLNAEFLNEYGESIYSFITNHRLQKAHEALLNTDVSIKMLSAELGYSHVTNFTIAFKRKFGYPPGSLRRSS